MRIIGGKHKRRKLFSVPGLGTRPTTDRVRETLFNIISFEIQDAYVLDLFAGTGAFGLESLSRGAKFSVFADNNKQALSVIKKNIECLKELKNSKVVKCDITKNLTPLLISEFKFNLVFLDPPYEKGMVKKTLINLGNSKLLANNAKIIVEHSKSEKIEQIELLSLNDERVYGRTKVSFLNYNND
ncbi:MAG: 16S rRNA (guanine(966)-N(2))-methyltransferase RsmD [Desulfobacterales bacterium]|nr:16S rRNA (guanine(966)-N(2))-methyltransferase RsmD [Desulfobacterales bacterium]